MKALSIRQPWAWAILHGGKPVENRSWQPRNPGLRFRGAVAIHAAAGMTRGEYEDALADMEFLDAAFDALKAPVPAREELLRGGIVGTARIVDIVTSYPSPWFTGPYGLVLADVRPTVFQPFKGALGFFDVPDNLVREA